MRQIRLDRLAVPFGFDRRTLYRWHRAGLIRATNRGPGRGRGLVLSPDEARETVALFLLRQQGVPLGHLKRAAAKLREANRNGSDFLALGTTATGKTILFDGHGAAAPLADERGQTYFAVMAFNLHTVRDRIEAVIREAAYGNDIP